MTCPICGDEDPALAAGAGELVTVLETGSQSLVAIARSILDAAGIPHEARNQSLQNLFGWGSVGTGFNVVTGPVRLRVPVECEEEARALLTELPEGPRPVEEEPDEDEG
ncbi:MAG: DUF2007 domain-containing protein [Acidobacteriota bacterium]